MVKVSQALLALACMVVAAGAGAQAPALEKKDVHFAVGG
jgi:hypothetical protein